MNPRRIAILIDGGFFLKRLPRLVSAKRCDTPVRIAACIRLLCRSHMNQFRGLPPADNDKSWIDHVYRIFYYDAHPYEGKAHHPISNRNIDYGKSDLANQRRALFDQLRRQRKVALRLGKVTREHDWLINTGKTKALLKTRELLAALPEFAIPEDPASTVGLTLTAGLAERLQRLRVTWASMEAGDITLGLRQKGVDMRIGIDIASLALKKQVDTIVLVAGDSDFVPAAKLARREGIDFVLDPLWQAIHPDLHEHIDGLQSGLPRPAEPASPEATAAPAAPAPETE